jgi:hypothetical protein
MAYWIVDPDRPSPGGCHAPFAVDVQPSALATDLEPR